MLFNLIFVYLFVYFIGFLASKLILKKVSLPVRIIVSFALGFGILSWIIIFLGFILNFELLNVILALLTILLFLFCKSRKIKFKMNFKMDVKFILLILPFFSLSFLHALFFPELYRDSMIYAYLTKLFYQRKNISFIEGGPSIALGFASNYPSAYQLIGAFTYFFTGENLISLRLSSFLFSFLLVLLVYCWAKDVFKEEGLSIYSVLFLISLPTIIFFSHSASQYIYLTFQFSLACFFLYRFLLQKNRSDLYASAIFAGFAALTSYLGLLFIFFLLLTFQLGKKFYKSILISLFLFFSVISPWYLRNFVILGNPVWPFGGGKYIDPLIQASSLNQLNKISKVAGFNYETLEDLKNSLIRLFFSFIDYHNASIYHGLNPIFTFLAIPALFLWLKTKDKKIKFFVLWFLILLAFYLVAVNYWNKYLILISVPTVFLSTYFVGYLQKFKIVKWLLVFFFGFLYINSLYLALFWDECPAGNINSPEILENFGNHQKILEACYGSDAKIWKWVNENIPENETIATNDFKLYYYNRTVIELSSWRLRGLFYSNDINETVRILKENNIRYLALIGDLEEMRKYPQHFKLIREVDSRAIYEVI
jgi:hypothetical protein